MKLKDIFELKHSNGTPVYISVEPRIGDSIGNFAIYDTLKTDIINNIFVKVNETKFVCMMCGELKDIKIMSKSITCMSCSETYKG